MDAGGQETLLYFSIITQIGKWILLILLLFGTVSFFKNTLKSGNQIQMFVFAGQNCYDLLQSIRLEALFADSLDSSIIWHFY